MLSNIIGMFNKLCMGSEHRVMCIVPHWFAIKASPLAVSMVIGVTEWRLLDRLMFPDMWLDVAESTSHMWALSPIVDRTDISVDSVTFEWVSLYGSMLLGTSVIHAIMLMFSGGCPAIHADAWFCCEWLLCLGCCMVWGLLKVFLPKACMQWSLCRRSIAQSFEATAELGLWQRVNLTNMKECDVCVWLSCVTVTMIMTCFLYWTGCIAEF